MKYLQVPKSIGGTDIPLKNKLGKIYSYKTILPYELLTKSEADKLGITEKLTEVDYPRHSIFKIEGHRLSTFDSERNKSRSDYMLKRNKTEEVK